MAEINARIESAKVAKKKADSDAAAFKAKQKAEKEAQQAVLEAETKPMDTATAARLSSQDMTRADTVLQKIEPRMPPPKIFDGEPPSKASIARTIAKKSPSIKKDGALILGPRAKSKPAPTRSR